MGAYPAWMWLTFAVVLAVLLSIDLLAHRGEHGQSRRAAIVWSAVWIAVGLAFGVFVWLAIGGREAQEYYAAYLIEKSLSVDNLFVFLLIFQSLAIPHNEQRRVLIWGILGALVFRAIFIFLGIRALETIGWMVYAFAAVLLWAAWRVVREDPRKKVDNKTVLWLEKHLPFTSKVEDHRFVTVQNGRRVVTPLLIALLALESTDIMFAIDSIPAALSVTREEFLVYSSNAFAILGLRALYVVLADLVAKLEYLHFGLAFVLAFAGVKLLLDGVLELPPWLSILIIVAALGVAVVASLLHEERPAPPERKPTPRGEMPGRA